MSCETLTPLEYTDCDGTKNFPSEISRLKVHQNGKCYDQDDRYIGELAWNGSGYFVEGKDFVISLKLP